MWNYHNPVRVHAGSGALQQLPRIVGQRQVILIAFPEAAGLGLLDKVSALLGPRLVAVETDVRPNPDVAWLAPLYERLWAQHPDAQCVVGLGGGSAIDCAKAMLVRGFAEPISKELPLEYAVEMNRLIDLEFEGAIG